MLYKNHAHTKQNRGMLLIFRPNLLVGTFYSEQQCGICWDDGVVISQNLPRDATLVTTEFLLFRTHHGANPFGNTIHFVNS